jgi:hypothetical protein
VRYVKNIENNNNQQGRMQLSQNDADDLNGNVELTNLTAPNAVLNNNNSSDANENNNTSFRKTNNKVVPTTSTTEFLESP